MPAGMQVWDESGRLLVDITTRITRVSGMTVIPAGSTGSLVVPNADQGTVWYALYLNYNGRYRPVISISGGTISWSPSSIGGTPVDVPILYGVY